MTRLEYLKTQTDWSELIRHTKMPRFDEFIVNRYGDIIVYRVYGNSKENYTVTAR